MSFIQDAVAHILSEMRRNGVETDEETRVEVRELVKEKLAKAEQQVFHAALTKFADKRETSDPLTIKDIRVYQSGAFNLLHFAPGGIYEVGEDGRPVPWETIRCPMCAEDGVKHDDVVCEEKYQARHGR